MTPLQASRAFRDLARVPSRVSGEVAKGIRKDIVRRFAAGQDPYGRPWAPLRPATLAKGRHPPPLTDTGLGLAGITVSPHKGAGIRILSLVPYMVYHMRRSGVRAARKFLPEGTLPRRWREIWQTTLVRRAREVIR